ncbi:YHS domain-containing protein [Candidatus Gottesmanbacteria bacterium RIFCSPLOWO2_02_FULL_38_8]|uniref:YHS domain-containing protein n=1 Tax=Candidatus Gottesmanbacteria bacterium RIFCSPLOWO2_02_FULL_38_8 TaxID=1798397 RepID=A0A1F6B3A6_9BACT|nr:MAG: YHS domain-containing protein [Candidatus Gottesmanbacteria bacterium RIFCSPLOWO2_02_FULL_38_8]
MFSGEGKAKDPVCGMSVDPQNSKFKSEFKGVTYFFCSQHCKTQFDQNPEQFISL